jgi:hypothetical protein
LSIPIDCLGCDVLHKLWLTNFCRRWELEMFQLLLYYFCMNSHVMLLYNFFYLICSQDFKHEVNLLIKLRHPNIVQFLGAVTETKPLMLITEFLRGVCILSCNQSFGMYYLECLVMLNWCIFRVIFINIWRRKVHSIQLLLLTSH